MRNFLGIILWMGLNTLSSLAHYWRQDLLFVNNINKVMARNRFELLLSVYHCGNNANANEDNRLYKIQDLVDILVSTFNFCYIPEKRVCIDESVVPFRGRIKFRQY